MMSSVETSDISISERYEQYMEMKGQMIPESLPVIFESAEIYHSGISVFTVGWSVFHLFGICCAIHALLSVRTPQGTIAWIATLITIPIIAVPAYLIFGRSKFKGFVFARQSEDAELKDIVDVLATKVNSFIRAKVEGSDESRGRILAVERLAKMPFLTGNHVELLVDGRETFDSIFAGIEKAQEFVLIQFFIVHDDKIGRALKNRLAEKASQGLRVFFLYDEVGCHKLPAAYIESLRDAGVRMQSFQTTRGSGNRFQLNFRNHRKVVLVDGREGWIGGHNVGDEYLSGGAKFASWRDTHMKITGP
jgi:cardiolipin synthase